MIIYIDTNHNLCYKIVMITCPDCEGTGITDITVHERNNPPYKMQLNCITCYGNKRVKQEVANDYHCMQNAWCRCDDVGHNITFYEDGQHPDMFKHHYRHEPGCGKIIQIG